MHELDGSYSSRESEVLNSPLGPSSDDDEARPGTKSSADTHTPRNEYRM